MRATGDGEVEEGVPHVVTAHKLQSIQTMLAVSTPTDLVYASQPRRTFCIQAEIRRPEVSNFPGSVESDLACRRSIARCRD